MPDHIMKAYDDDLAALQTMLSTMGGLAEEQLSRGLEALTRRDTKLADQVIHADDKIDEMERNVEEKAILTIARRQPMAKDLRHIMVAIRIAADLERIGDLAKNVAKRAHAIVQAVTHYNDPQVLAEVSEDLGEPMVGINIDTLAENQKMAGRGWCQVTGDR